MPNTNEKAASSSASSSLSKQERWEEFSEKTTSNLAKMMKKRPSFTDVLTYLAEQRSAIANELGHLHKTKNGEGTSAPFGRFSNSRMFHYETATSAPQVAKTKLLEYLKNGKLKQIRTSWRGNKYKFPIPEPYVLVPSDLSTIVQFVRYNHDVRRANLDERTKRQKFMDPVSESPLSELRIVNESPLEFTLEYPLFTSVDLIMHYAIAVEYYNNLLNWNEEKGLDNFLENSAKLSYFLAHRLPIERGTSAIVEWMIKGIAQFKGLENFPAKVYETIDGEALNWSWRALIEPDINNYIQWYSSNAKQMGLSLPESTAAASSSSSRPSQAGLFSHPPASNSLTRMKKLLIRRLLGDEKIPKHLQYLLETNSLSEMFRTAENILDSPQIRDHEDYTCNPNFETAYQMLCKYRREPHLSATNVVDEFEHLELKPNDKGCSIM